MIPQLSESQSNIDYLDDLSLNMLLWLIHSLSLSHTHYKMILKWPQHLSNQWAMHTLTKTRIYVLSIDVRESKKLNKSQKEDEEEKG